MDRPLPTCPHGTIRCLIRCANCGHRCDKHYTNGCHDTSELGEVCFCRNFQEAQITEGPDDPTTAGPFIKPYFRT